MAKSQSLSRPALLTVKETAALLRCSEKTIRRRLSVGDLPYSKPKGTNRILIRRSDVDAYIAAGECEAVDAWDL